MIYVANIMALISREHWPRGRELLVEGECEFEVALCSARCWDCRNRADLIESAIPMSSRLKGKLHEKVNKYSARQAEINI